MDAFESLSDGARRSILRTISRCPDASVSEIVRLTGTPQPTVSKQLSALKAAGLVVAKKNGTQRLYRIQQDTLAAVIAELNDITMNGEQA